MLCLISHFNVIWKQLFFKGFHDYSKLNFALLTSLNQVWDVVKKFVFKINEVAELAMNYFQPFLRISQAQIKLGRSMSYGKVSLQNKLGTKKWLHQQPGAHLPRISNPVNFLKPPKAWAAAIQKLKITRRRRRRQLEMKPADNRRCCCCTARFKG